MNAITSFWILTRAVVAILPTILMMIREGQIREATAAEIENAFIIRWSKRVEDALAAEGIPVDEATDPYNRTRT